MGILSGTEIAVVTARKSHIKELAESRKQTRKDLSEAQRRTRSVPGHHSDRDHRRGRPGLGRGWGRGRKGDRTFPPALPITVISLGAEPIAIGIVVVIITYFSVIFGELVPKSIALMHPETIGLWSARTIDAFSKINAIFVKVLT